MSELAADVLERLFPGDKPRCGGRVAEIVDAQMQVDPGIAKRGFVPRLAMVVRSR